jgi:hypothetical protein
LTNETEEEKASGKTLAEYMAQKKRPNIKKDF